MQVRFIYYTLLKHFIKTLVRNILLIIKETFNSRMAGHIQDDQTAEPFNPYTTKKPRVQGDDTKNNIDGVTDDPSAADDDSLPR